ncbi:MAG: D-lyxose/D-mannose family sugar isomerase [Chloroflexota bacterium]
MANTITNNMTGEVITFLERTPDLLKFEDTLPGNMAGVPPHIHDRQTETFTVLDGVFHAVIDGEHKTLNAGESITVPAGVAHSFHTKNSGPVKLLVELSPALDYETFFRTMASDQAQQRLAPFQIAVMTQDLDLGFYLGGIPKAVQNVMFAGVAAIARMLGYRASY